MGSSKIKNVVFDIGNVLVRWGPSEIVRLTFGDAKATEELAKSIFQSEIWLDLNKGLISEADAKSQYQSSLGLDEFECERLFYYVKQTQILIFGSVDLLKRVKAAGYNVYALTDNVHEIVSHLKHEYTFWSLFDGTTVSADLGVLKPQPEIYHALLTQNQIEASETVFIDDMPYNVVGAEACGISAIQFENAAQCEDDLKSLGLSF
ncbi:HAD family phosphatase [Vibrio makurazakiensis]|uniref:HAD family hydrolase n=1 Tax=Vibrio makurazakiensis TaxID=2910250 RepID=UPI003D0AC3C5